MIPTSQGASRARHNAAPDRAAWLYALFALFCATCLWNLNGVFGTALGRDRMLSGVILAAGCLLGVQCRNSVGRALGAPGRAFLAFMAIYLFLGTVAIWDPPLIVRHAASAFIVVVAAAATRVLVLRTSLSMLLFYLSAIAFAGACTIFLSPFLTFVYVNLDDARVVLRSGRWQGFFMNANEAGFSAVYALTCVLALSRLHENHPRWTAIYTFAKIVLAIAVTLTFSRSAMLTFAGILFANQIYELRRSGRGIGKWFVGGTLLAIAFWFFFGGYQHFEWKEEQRRRLESIERIGRSEELDSRDLGSRDRAIQHGLHLWQKSPFTGHGFGVMRTMGVYGQGSHNTHILILGEVGLIGFVFYVAWLYVFALKSWRCVDPVIKQFCLLLFLALVCHSMVSHYVLIFRPFNVLMGVAIGLLSVGNGALLGRRFS